MKRWIMLCLWLSGFWSLSAQKVTSPEMRSSFSLLELNRAMIIHQLSLQDSSDVKHKPSVMIYQQEKRPVAFFCKIEDRMERTGKLPLRIRLGDLRYTNWMEGKNVYDIYP